MVYDDALPTLAQPIPSSGPITDSYLPMVLVDKLRSESVVSSRLVSISTGVELLIPSSNITREARGALTALWIRMPSGLVKGTFLTSVMIHITGQETLKLDLTVAMFNPNDMRMVSTTPTELPTAIIIRGKRIHLWYFVTIVCAQCLAGQSISAYSASVGTERAEVTSVVDINTCALNNLDHHCTRTFITIKAPVLDAPAEEVPVIVRTNSGE